MMFVDADAACCGCDDGIFVLPFMLVPCALLLLLLSALMFVFGCFFVVGIDRVVVVIQYVVVCNIANGVVVVVSDYGSAVGVGVVGVVVVIVGYVVVGVMCIVYCDVVAVVAVVVLIVVAK